MQTNYPVIICGEDNLSNSDLYTSVQIERNNYNDDTLHKAGFP